MQGTQKAHKQHKDNDIFREDHTCAGLFREGMAWEGIEVRREVTSAKGSGGWKEKTKWTRCSISRTNVIKNILL